MGHLHPFNWLLGGALFLLLCGVVCDRYAVRKGLDRKVWFFIGFLFGPIGLIMLACVPARDRWADPEGSWPGHAGGEVDGDGREWWEERGPRNLNPRVESHPFRLKAGRMNSMGGCGLTAAEQSPLQTIYLKHFNIL